MQAAFLEAALANIDFKTNVFDVSFLPWKREKVNFSDKKKIKSIFIRAKIKKK
jgi:hypothetical protein